MTRPKTLFAHLKELQGQCGEYYWQRVGLAETLLADNVWLANATQGDESRAIDHLERTVMADLCVALSLPQLLVLRRETTLDFWRKHNFNLRAIWRAWKGEAKRPQPRVLRDFVHPLQFGELTASQQRKEYTRLYNALLKLKGKVTQ